MQGLLSLGGLWGVFAHPEMAYFFPVFLGVKCVLHNFSYGNDVFQELEIIDDFWKFLSKLTFF